MHEYIMRTIYIVNENRTKALPSESDKADKSPPVKMTRRTKALP
jgi:hypothetical protein